MSSLYKALVNSPKLFRRTERGERGRSRGDQEQEQGDKEKEQEASRMVTPSSEVILKSRRCHKRVALNVGGVRHEVTWRLLEQYPQSRWI